MVFVYFKRLHGHFTFLSSALDGILKLRNDGILHRYPSNRCEYNLESIKELSSKIGEFVNHRPVPVLVKADELVILPIGARELLAKTDTCPYEKAVAYKINTLVHQILIKFYIENDKPERPTKIFENLEDAIDWLKTFL